MANKFIRQFRYYDDNSENNRNYPGSLTQESLINGSAFKSCYPITQLGVQGLPGTKFYLNGDKYPIVIGAVGLYDLDIKNGMRVTQLQFAKDSIEQIKNTNSAVLIVDILAEGKES